LDLTAAELDVVNQEYDNDPEKQDGQVTPRGEVGYLLVDRLAVLAGAVAPGAAAVDGLGLLRGGVAEPRDRVGHQRQRDHGEDEYEEQRAVLLRRGHGCCRSPFLASRLGRGERELSGGSAERRI